jgi:hypothetical protein
MSDLYIYMEELKMNKDPEYYDFICQMERELLEQQMMEELKEEFNS